MSGPSGRSGNGGGGPVAAGGAAATGRISDGASARRGDAGEHEVVVRAGERRLGHLALVVAVVREVLVDRQVPAVVGDRGVEVLQRPGLGVAGGAEGTAESLLDVRVGRLLQVREAAVDHAGDEAG